MKSGGDGGSSPEVRLAKDDSERCEPELALDDEDQLLSVGERERKCGEGLGGVCGKGKPSPWK